MQNASTQDYTVAMLRRRQPDAAAHPMPRNAEQRAFEERMAAIERAQAMIQAEWTGMAARMDALEARLKEREGGSEHRTDDNPGDPEPE